MRSKILLLLFMAMSFSALAQTGYKKVYKLNEYNKDWSLVKTVSGTYGFIDKGGKVIVQPIYSKIEKFGKYDENLALVKSIADTYGFIDKNGKEIIPAIYKLDDIKNDFKGIYKKHIKTK